MEVIIPDKEAIIRAITCLECGVIPRDNTNSQVYMCGQGHLFCITCITRGSFREKKCRKRHCQEALKKVLEPILADIFDNCFFACSNKLCPDAILGIDLQNHKIYCHYAPIVCPDCGVRVEFENYLLHLEQMHQVPVRRVNGLDWLQWIPVEFPPKDENGYTVAHYHTFQGRAFFVHLIVKPKGLYVWIQYYGGYREEEDYNVTIRFFNQQGHQTDVTVPVNSIREDFRRARELQYYAHFSGEMLRCYAMDTNNNCSATSPTNGTGNITGGLRRQSAIRKPSVTRLSINSETEMPGGKVHMQVLYKHNYLKTFTRNFIFEQQAFGFDSEC